MKPSYEQDPHMLENGFLTQWWHQERERDLDITSLVFLVYLLDSMDPGRVNVSYSWTSQVTSHYMLCLREVEELKVKLQNEDSQMLNGTIAFSYSPHLNLDADVLH
jgi:hypothetical protein